jgi:hypothetical protein
MVKIGGIGVAKRGLRVMVDGSLEEFPALPLATEAP